MKIGFLGGSFDPVHFGHLCAAQDAFEQQQLDRLIFVPAAQAPLKPHEALAPAEDRLALLRLAIAGNARFAISDYELRQGGVSYTINSVRHFQQLYPHDRLFWVIGGDQLLKMPQWKSVEELVRSIEFIVLERPGHPVKTPPAIAGLKLHRCAGHRLEISSTELRERAKRGLSLDYFMPHKTVVFIAENALYRR